MRKTIKEDNERLILQRELLNDNALLEISTNNGFVEVGVRFVDSSMREIKEHILINMETVEFMKHQDNLIQINDDKDTIAIYKPVGEKYELVQIYDIENHQYAISDFIDIVYNEKFPKPLKDSYIKEKVK